MVQYFHWTWLVWRKLCMKVSSQKSWLQKTIGVTVSCSNSINILYKDVKACKLYSNRTIIFSWFFQKSYHCLTWRSNSMNAKNSRNLWIEFRQKRSEGPEWVEACAFCLVPERKVINFATRSFNSEYWMFSSRFSLLSVANLIIFG